MTNKQTIEGVSIEQLKRDDRLFHVAKNWRGCDRGWVKFIHDEGDGLVRVRHENGAVPTVKLSNLQMRAMTPEQELSEFYEELSTGGKLTKRALCHIKSLQAEIAALNKPADQPQGEVERLQLLVQAGQHVEDHLSKQIDIAEITIQGLRAKLDERDALLREALNYIRADGGFTTLDDKIEDCLSTSAEPKPRGEVDGNSHASKQKAESVLIQAVAVTRKDDDEGLRLEWLLEGGIAEMEFPGMVLFAMPEANDLCAEDGSAEIYLSPQSAEQPAPVAEVLPKLEMAHVVQAHMGITSFPILTSNQCYALAMKLNSILADKAKLNGLKP